MPWCGCKRHHVATMLWGPKATGRKLKISVETLGRSALGELDQGATLMASLRGCEGAVTVRAARG